MHSIKAGEYYCEHANLSITQGYFLECSSKGGGVHDSYTFQCGLVGYFTSPGVYTR